MSMTHDQIIHCIRNNYQKWAPTSPYRPTPLAQRLGVRLSTNRFISDRITSIAFQAFQKNKDNEKSWKDLKGVLAGRTPFYTGFSEKLTTPLATSMRNDCCTLSNSLQNETSGDDDVNAAKFYECMGDLLKAAFKLPT